MWYKTDKSCQCALRQLGGTLYPWIFQELRRDHGAEYRPSERVVMVYGSRQSAIFSNIAGIVNGLSDNVSGGIVMGAGQTAIASDISQANGRLMFKFNR